MDMAERPKFVVFVGPQFSEKTAKLLLAVDRYRHQHKRIVAFMPVADISTRISSHTGLFLEAHAVSNSTDIFRILSSLDNIPDIVVVDKVFMIENVCESLVWLFRSGVTILATTLDLSATLKPFKEAQRVMSWATHIEKCVAVCDICGEDAHYTHKKTSDNEDIFVGGEEAYSPRCAKCHPLFMTKENP